MLEKVWREENLHPLGQPLGKEYGCSLNRLKIELPYDSVILLLGMYLSKTKTLTQKDTCTPMFIEALLKIGKNRNNASAHKQMIDLRRCGVHVILVIMYGCESWTIKKAE